MEERRQHRGKYPDELRERAVRMVLDHQNEYGSKWEAICSVAEKLGPKAEAVRRVPMLSNRHRRGYARSS